VLVKLLLINDFYTVLKINLSKHSSISYHSFVLPSTNSLLVIYNLNSSYLLVLTIAFSTFPCNFLTESHTSPIISLAYCIEGISLFFNSSDLSYTERQKVVFLSLSGNFFLLSIDL